MIKFLVLLLSLSVSAQALAEQAGDRLLGLTTQDKNGLHIVFVAESPSKVLASVRRFSPGYTGEAQLSDYPRERFDELWLRTQELDLSAFASGNDASNVEATKNYVLTVETRSNGVSKRTIYLIPKCGPAPNVVSLVMRLTADLLPAGSPGLFESCPSRAPVHDG